MTAAPAPTPTAPTTLARRLGLTDAVMIGLGSMVGAGVFAAFAPAAAAAGRWLLLGLALAALVASCNATSSAQLAARYPASGGTYVYGRAELGHWPGFLAGWCFVVGKTASCAAMALTFAAYAVPQAWQRPAALVAVWVLAGVNLFGVTRTARLARTLAVVVLLVLAVFCVLAWTGSSTPAPTDVAAGHGPLGILQSAGFLFFAFAGYARIATMGEEVVEPERTIPRAIVLALGIALVVYLLVALALLHGLGAARLGASAKPLADALTATGRSAWTPLARFGAAAAALGSLLSLVTGVGRTTLAMAREADLPTALSAVDPVHRVPRRAELALALVLTVLVLVTDLRGAIGFSSFGVLLYYFIANASAWHQTEGRRYPRLLQGLGMVLCLALVASLPLASIAAGAAMVALGVVIRMVAGAVRP